MLKAPIPANDYLRVQNLHELGILDSPQEDEFTDIVQLASRICDAPISLISLVDYSRQWFKAKVGIDATETPRDISFCGHAILMDHDFFEVADALQDARFFDNPLVLSAPNIRFYAGVQLVSRKGFKIGMLCVNDTKPNKLNQEQIFALRVLGNHVAKLLDLRITRKQSDEKTRKIESQNEVLKKMLSIIAHDIRGPIGSLKTFFEMSKADLLEAETKEKLVNMSITQIDNTLGLLNNLVDWGNIQISRESSILEKVCIKGLVFEEINSIQLGAAIKNNQLVNLVSESLELNFDANMLKFIIRNLLTNANKYTKNGTITVYSDTNDPFEKIIVHDTGVGMSAANIEVLLQKDSIISTAGTSNEKGSGLGFKLIKDFMEKIGGWIDIKSSVGKGTSVILYFPRF